MASTGAVIQETGNNLPAGIKVGTICQKVDMSIASASHAVTPKLPAGAVVLSAELKLPMAISATTAVKVGLGRLTSSADPDKYLISANLTAQTIGPVIEDFFSSPLTAEEEMAVFACATDGSAAGTIGGAGQYAYVAVTYMVPVSLTAGLT